MSKTPPCMHVAPTLALYTRHTHLPWHCLGPGRPRCKRLPLVHSGTSLAIPTTRSRSLWPAPSRPSCGCLGPARQRCKRLLLIRSGTSLTMPTTRSRSLRPTPSHPLCCCWGPARPRCNIYIYRLPLVRSEHRLQLGYIHRSLGIVGVTAQTVLQRLAAGFAKRKRTS